MRKLKNRDLFVESLRTSTSISEAIKKVGLIPAGGNYATAHSLIREFNIDVSHMTGMGWNVGDKFGLSKINTIPLSEILVENSKYTSTSHLKIRIFNSKLKEKICECCGLIEWNGLEIPLELHHLNGCRTDNRIENLKILCPNCHAQTDGYRGNKRKTKL